jgi:hypothetical protein
MRLYRKWRMRGIGGSDMRQEALDAKKAVWKEVEKKTRRGMSIGWFKRIFGSSMYMPHQSNKECERRLRQIERGVIK